MDFRFQQHCNNTTPYITTLTILLWECRSQWKLAEGGLPLYYNIEQRLSKTSDFNVMSVIMST